MPEPIPTGRRALFALGTAGFQITDRIVVGIALYFYLPPAGRGLPPQVPERVFLGVLTAFGLAMLVGRIFDSLADPLVGHASDRSRSRLGRRRAFLVAGVGPMVAIPVLLFFPPGAPGSVANVVWLALLLSFYFVFFTVYVAPYLALLPEIAWTETGRVQLATWMGLVSFPVFLYGAGWTWGYEAGVAAGLAPDASLRVLVVVSAALAFGLCLLPIWAVDERRFARSVPAALSLRRAIAATLRNRPFLLYLVAQMLFILGVNMIQPALPYYAVAVLGRSEGYAGNLMLAVLASTLASLILVGRCVRRFGAKRTMVLCLTVFSAALIALGALDPDLPGGDRDRANLAILWGACLLIGVPVAGFLVLPYVLLSQLIDLDASRTGMQRAAMYFGLQGFVTKWVYGAATALLAFLFARFGNSVAQPTGVLLVGPIAGLACLAAALLYAVYPERAVLAETASPARADAARPEAARE